MISSAVDEVELPMTAENDVRVTRTGRILRLYRLDEIPQLWNVVRGDMSLIGPRPELPHNSADYDLRIPNYRHRRSLSPGITGWAQVHVGYALGLDETRRKLDYDLDYITNVSPGVDLLVLVKTIPTVLFRRGAR
jgi:lipopolysaccharide/colanic/teichoic acid biosynthesis glycosyltransferase